EGALLVVCLALVDLGHRLEGGDASRRFGGKLGAREQELDELLPRALRPIDLLELQRSGEIDRVVREDPLIDLARAVAVADLVLPDRRRLQKNLDLGDGLIERVGFPLEDPDALLPAGLLREQLLERPERAEVARLQTEHALPSIDRLLRTHEDLALER